MRVDASTSTANPQAPTHHTSLTISKWVNEPYPPLSELLSTHDVARLTRRPRWMLTGLCLIGRFPKKLKFRGREIGWRRSEILDWMSRDLAVVRDREFSPRSCARKHPRQACLPLECATSCVPTRKCASHRPVAACNNRGAALR